MDNYDYCTQWAAEQGGKVLDFGCGAGQTVAKMRAKGVDAYGCDTFFEGGDLSEGVPKELVNTFIKRMESNTIPFPDEHFDVVVTNMVMEHVPDIDGALSEIRRVLKPGGRALSLFPHKSIWMEGHSLVPFLHWFPKGSTSRVYIHADLELHWLRRPEGTGAPSLVPMDL